MVNAKLDLIGVKLLKILAEKLGVRHINGNKSSVSILAVI